MLESHFLLLSTKHHTAGFVHAGCSLLGKICCDILDSCKEESLLSPQVGDFVLFLGEKNKF